jgi:hypothetical protein
MKSTQITDSQSSKPVTGVVLQRMVRLCCSILALPFMLMLGAVIIGAAICAVMLGKGKWHKEPGAWVWRKHGHLPNATAHPRE